MDVAPSLSSRDLRASALPSIPQQRDVIVLHVEDLPFGIELPALEEPRLPIGNLCPSLQQNDARTIGATF